jgi:hypothetical protein
MPNTVNDGNPLEQPIRLGKRFWILCIMVTPMTLYLTTPWKWGLPWFAVAAGCIALPFFVGLPTYAMLLFSIAVWRKKIPASKLFALASVITYLVVGSALIMRMRSSPGLAEIGMFMISSTAVVLYGVLAAKRDSASRH